MLDEARLCSLPEEDYMNEAQLEFFRERLLALKQTTLNHLQEARRYLRSRPQCSDEADRAQYEEESRLYLRIIDRESKLLPKIDQALKRIDTGEYGYCEISGEPIGIERLLIRPTATLCAEVKQQEEQKEKFYADC